MADVPRWIELPPHVRRVLPSGLVLVVLERRTLPLVTLRLVLPGGSARDPASLPGLASLCARTLKFGAGPRDAARFAEDLDHLGGRFQAGTGLDSMVADAEFTTATLDRGLELYLSTILEPRFDEAELERERQRAIAEVVQSRDDPDAVADEAYMAWLFGAHPYGHPAQGTVSALQRTTREDVLRFHREAVTPGGAVLVVVGDVDREAFADRLAQELSGWAAGPVPVPPVADAPRHVGRRVVLVHDQGSGQVQYRLGNVGVARRTPLWHPLTVANTVLGGGFTSRLVHEVRVVRGLTYGIHSRFLAGRGAGPFTISTFTRNDTLGQLHEVVTGELSRLRAEGISEDETASAKSFLIGGQVRRLEPPEALAAAVAEAEIHALGYGCITGYRQDIEAVTAATASDAARQSVPLQDLLCVLVGDRAKIEDVARTLGDLTVVGPDFAEGAPEDAA
jgi:zinc protease